MSSDSPARPRRSILDDRDGQGLRNDLQTVVDGLSDLSYRVTTTASAWINPSSSIVKDITPHLKRPSFQKRLLSSTSPHELLRNNLSPSEISYRQITYLSEDLLRDIPEPAAGAPGGSDYTLFQGFEASIPQNAQGQLIKGRAGSGSGHHRAHSVSQGRRKGVQPPTSHRLERERDACLSSLEVLKIRKALASTEIKEVDTKLTQLKAMRQDLMTKLEVLEAEEAETTSELQTVETRLQHAQAEEAESVNGGTRQGSRPASTRPDDDRNTNYDDEAHDADPSFLSESTYGSMSRTNGLRHTSSQQHHRKRKAARRKSAPLLQQHYEPGSLMKTFAAHTESITALDFDYPFGTLVTASLDDTTRVWNLATGRCTGLLEGHVASVQCLQLEDSIVVTGSTDAKLKVWDLAVSDSHLSQPSSAVSSLIGRRHRASFDRGGDTDSDAATTGTVTPSVQMRDLGAPPVDCCLHTLDAHVGEVTALHFSGAVLVSGSSDKTIRHWDLASGRLVQTMDILSHATQPLPSHSRNVSSISAPGPAASSLHHAEDPFARSFSDSVPQLRPAAWRRQPSYLGTGLDATLGTAGYVGALQCFEQGLAAGTADGMVRFWDLRSGQVARELFGHTGPVTALQFDSLHLVSGSLDRSVRIWDLRTGAIADAFAYERPITSLQFDARKIVAAAGERFVRVYDRIESRHWGCGEDEEHDDVNAVAVSNSPVLAVRQRDSVCIGGRADGNIAMWSV